MKKALFAMAVLFVLIVPLFCFAEEEEIPVLQARVAVAGGEVKINSLQIVYGTPTPQDERGAFIAQLLDRSSNEIYQLRFSLDEVRSTFPEDLPPEDYNAFIEQSRFFEATLYFPYLDEAEIVSIGQENKSPIAFFGVKEDLCNSDGKCGETENFLSCPADCPLDKEDNYCLPEGDGICDPDCIAGLDPDCASAVVGGGTESKGLSLTEMYFIGVVIAAFLIIAGYNVLKIRKGKAGKKSK
jgi:hypothetical protein